MLRAARVAVKPISIHALREEGDWGIISMHSKSVQFLSTPSARRATATAGIGSTGGYNFYPRPPRGGRPGFVLLDMIACYFYPRPPRGGRLVDMEILGLPLEISIHALREEGDAIRPRSS